MLFSKSLVGFSGSLSPGGRFKGGRSCDFTGMVFFEEVTMSLVVSCSVWLQIGSITIPTSAKSLVDAWFPAALVLLTVEDEFVVVLILMASDVPVIFVDCCWVLLEVFCTLWSIVRVPITAVQLKGLVTVFPLVMEEVVLVHSGSLIPLFSSCEQFWNDSGWVTVSWEDSSSIVIGTLILVSCGVSGSLESGAITRTLWPVFARYLSQSSSVCNLVPPVLTRKRHSLCGEWHFSLKVQYSNKLHEV